MAHTVIHTTGAKHHHGMQGKHIAAKLQGAAATDNKGTGVTIPVKHGKMPKHGAKGMHLKHGA